MENFKVQEFVAHSTQVNCLAFGPKSNQVLASGGEDTKVNIWRVGNVSNIWALSSNKSPIECLCFDSDEQNVVSGARSGSLKVFDLNEGRLARNLGGHQVNITSIQYHPFGEFIVSGSVDCTMKVWDVRNRACIQTYTGHSKEMTCVRFSPDGKWVASSSKDGQLLLWDLVAGKLLNSIKLQPTFVTSFEFNPTEFSLAGVTSAKAVKIWDLETMDQLHSTPPDSNPIRAIAYSNLGTKLCSSSKDTLRVWDVENTPKVKPVGMLDMGWDRIYDMKISNETQLIAGSCLSNFVTIYAVDLEDLFSINNSNNFNEEKVEAKFDIPSTKPPVGPISSNRPIQQQQVKQKLSQLANDLEALEIQQKERNSGNNNNPVVGSDSKPINPTRINASNSKDENCNAYGYAEKGAASKLENNNPEVQWDSPGSAAGLAASMGESFWKRFKEMHPTNEEEIINNNNNNIEEENFDFDDNNDDLDINDSNQSDLLSNDELADLLANNNKPVISHHSKRTPSSNTNNSHIQSSPGGSVPAIQMMNKAPARPGSRPVAGAFGPPTGPSSAKKEIKNNFNNNQDYQNNIISQSDMQLEVVGMKQRKANFDDNLAPVVAISNVSQAPARPNTKPVLPKSYQNSNGGGRPTTSQNVHNPLITREECTDLIHKTLQTSSSISSLLSQRLTSLRLLRQLWTKHEISETINELKALSDAITYNPSNLILLADFFEAMQLNGQGLSLDACVQIMPVINDMISYNYYYNDAMNYNAVGVGNGNNSNLSDHVIHACFRSLISLAEAFGELIRQTRSSIVVVSGGVDLTREARLEKCNICHAIFLKTKGRIDQFKHHFRKNDRILDCIDAYQRLANIYFN
eukprot:gene6458-8882_t